MLKKRDHADPFHRERRKIRESGVLDALIDYVEGKRDLSSGQVTAALGLLKKSISDPSENEVEELKSRSLAVDLAQTEIRRGEP
ncbi:MAG: hypothetical protein ACOZAM_25480 [Pseudomonadota bacterium]